MPPFSSSLVFTGVCRKSPRRPNAPKCQTPIVAFTEERSKITTHWCEKVECLGRIRDMLTFVADRTF
jgi:hypothetical protein